MIVEEDVSEVGSGSLAAELLPTWVLSISLQDDSPEQLAKNLRMSNPPIFGRIKDDKFLLDLRTIRKDEFRWIAEALQKILETPTEPPRDSDTPPDEKTETDIADTISDEVREIDDSENFE